MPPPLLHLLHRSSLNKEEKMNIDFIPINFVKNLTYMGVGMLGVFMIVGVIVLATYAVGKLTAPKSQDGE